MPTRGERVVLGLLADPEAPAELAREFVDQLPGLLSEQSGGWSWDVRVLVERLPLVDGDYRDLLTVARERRRQQQWDYVICLTRLAAARKWQPGGRRCYR